jgi:hypothetical protein
MTPLAILMVVVWVAISVERTMASAPEASPTHAVR